MLPLIKTGKATGNILFGRMYGCRYFALKREPLFDLWPIIIVMDVKSKWFEGLNLHYLPLDARKELFPLLKRFIINRDGNYFLFREFKRVLYTQTFRLAQVCVKRYRKENIFGGRTIRIRDDLWENILYEKRERFFRWQGQNLRSLKSPIIWRESIRKSRGVGK
tara:strand:- start:68 stop:559 length:492 start_codon:yes stop_codon:yes gene_type:complete